MTSSRGDNSATARMTASNWRASRAGSWSSTSNSGQHPCASRRRCPDRTPAIAAAGDLAITRLARSTAAGTVGATPAATTGQSGHHTVTILGTITRPARARRVRRSPRWSPVVIVAAVAGSISSGRPVMPGSHISRSTGRGTRRPLARTTTRRRCRCPWPRPSPSHSPAVTSSTTSAPAHEHQR